MPSASRASGRSASSASPPRSRTPCTTRRGADFARCPSPSISSFELDAASALRALLVPLVALPFGHDRLRLALPIGGERAADIDLIFRELALGVPPGVPLVALVGLDQLALAWHMLVS